SWDQSTTLGFRRAGESCPVAGHLWMSACSRLMTFTKFAMTSAAWGSEQTHQLQGVRLVVDAIPTLAWAARADGSADFFNQRWLDYTGLSAEQARDWGWTVALHPDDLNGLVDYWRSVLGSGGPGEIEGRLRRLEGVYRWFLFRATP